LQAARTPNLDALASRGACGHMYPLSPGECPSSDIAHWSILGYSEYPFCGRTSLEAIGAGHRLEEGEVLFRVNLATTTTEMGKTYVQVAPAYLQDEEASELYAELATFEASDFGSRLIHLGGPFMALVLSGGASPKVTDSDPLFYRLPVPRIVPLDDAPAAAAATASELTRFSEFAAEALSSHKVNVGRVGAGMNVINSVLIKWPSFPPDVPSFAEAWGFNAVALASGVFYKGLATALGIEFHSPPDCGPGEAFEWELKEGLEYIEGDRDFAFLRTKSADEASHAGDPKRKVAVLEELDHKIAILLDSNDARDDLLIAITADHASPSGGSEEVIHSGESVPVVLVGGTVRVDGVVRFDEVSCCAGSLGQLRGRDVMPLLLNATNRARFITSRTNSSDRPYRPIG